MITRFAPSTTGEAHPGTLVSALLVWLEARRRGDQAILRLEDLDVTRVKAGWAEEALTAQALAHLIANGDLAGIILFLSFLAWAVYDRISVKKRGALGPLGAKHGGATQDIIVVVVGTVAYLAMLFGAIGTFEQRMQIALAGYLAYVINAAQFLLKLRAARLEGTGTGTGTAPAG